MRLSLLLQREPLGQIIEKTLSRFWQEQYSRPYRVRWYPRRPNMRAIRQQGEQVWLGNIYLNAIFTPDAEAPIFDPIRREFSRSVSPWKRPLQRAYVNLASARLTAPRLAHVGLGVTPDIPNARQKLIIAGNHKLRVLDYNAGLAYGILKDGFTPHFMRREIEARQLAATLGLPVPPLEQVAPDKTWFSEQYISATPINRLPDPQVARRAVATAVKSLNRLLEHTAQEEPLDDYAARLHSRIQTQTSSNHLLSEEQKRELLQNTEMLVAQIGDQRPAAGARITTALTHGDFHPANILLNDEGVWLIDWEYSARRQIGYDALVFTLHSRFPRGLAGRWQRFVAHGLSDSAPIGGSAWPGVDWLDTSYRRLSGALFLLEELELHLAENANPRFVRLGEGLGMLQQEIDHCHP